MAKYHKHHSLARTVVTALHTLHEYLSELLSVGLEFYVIKEYMTQHDTGLAVRIRKGMWASEFQYNTLCVSRASGT